MVYTHRQTSPIHLKVKKVFKHFLINCILINGSSPPALLVAQRVKRLPTMWETWVLSPGWEDLLEKEMATHSSTLAWKILWMEEPGRL